MAGKSCHGLFMLYQLLDHWNRGRVAYNAQADAPARAPYADLTIIYQVSNAEADGLEWYRFTAAYCTAATPTHAVGDSVFDSSLSTSIDTFRVDLRRRQTLYVVDGRGPLPGEASCLPCAAFTVWFLSARADYFKHLTNKLATTHPVLVQPPWSFREMEELRQKSFSGVLSADFVLALFDRWGGVPRQVLQFPATRIRSIQPPPALPAAASLVEVEDVRQLTSAVYSSSVDRIMEWTRKMDKAGAGLSEDVSYKVLHIYPASLLDGSPDYKTIHVRFASTWMADACVKLYLTAQRAELYAFLLAARNEPALAATAGHMLEGIFHNLIRQSPPVTFQRQQLDPPLTGAAPADEQVSFPIGGALDPASNERQEVVFATNVQLTAAPTHALLRAEKSNYPTIESLIQLPVASAGPPALTSSLFQVTASLTHPLKVNHLPPVLTNSQPGPAHPYHLYLCVPQHNYAAFTRQNYQVDGATVTPASAAWPSAGGHPLQLVQYKLSVPIASLLLPAQAAGAATLVGDRARGRGRQKRKSPPNEAAAAAVSSKGRAIKKPKAADE